MGTEISTITYGDIERMAAAMAKSGLFGVKTPDQAVALMLVAQAEGRHPASAARDYDIIQNRPSKKAEAMLRDFISAGGKVEWHKLDDTMADATFSHAAGGSVRISWDMARAKKAGIGGKDMWDKYPRQMLRSRCVSEGVRTVFPMATSGMYVPEEVDDSTPPYVGPENARDVTPKVAAAKLDAVVAAEAPPAPLPNGVVEILRGDEIAVKPKAEGPILVDADGAVIGEYKKAASYLDAFEKLLKGAPDKEARGKLWAANAGVYTRINEMYKTNKNMDGMARCDEVASVAAGEAQAEAEWM